MFSDLNLSDMETCYKVFRRDVIRKIKIEEDRFGFEPEIVAKVAQLRLRIYEMGIAYYGRTYAEGKKIGWKDGLRALFCIFHYNAHTAPFIMQLMIYTLIGGIAGVINLALFAAMVYANLSITISAGTAYILAAISNYLLCILFLFRHKARWSSFLEVLMYLIVVVCSGLLDVLFTVWLTNYWQQPLLSKAVASVLVLIFNFVGRKYLVFHEVSAGDWKPQHEGPDRTSRE
jgi:putative flippase GtrA